MIFGRDSPARRLLKARILLKADVSEAGEGWSDRRLVERFEWHYTPKHGSWFDLAESELGVQFVLSPTSKP